MEEEYLLVDVRTRATVPRAAAVLRDASRVLGPRAQAEFYATQVEGWSEQRHTARLPRIRPTNRQEPATVGWYRW
ncbi:hypothetical protein C2142_01770 [Streptomyces sp. CB01881]|nr:hypothetical protein C2142_01770 [Streptomyces sp. CB01881]